MPPPRHPHAPGVFLLALLATLAAPSEARAELCDREGYIRHGADCSNAERDFTGCCPGPALLARARAERAAAVRASAAQARARADAVRARAEAARARNPPCARGTARTSPGQPCCYPGQRAEGAFCRCPAGWALREREAHPSASRACLPEGRHGSGMILFDERGQARDWPDDRPGLLVDRQPVSREEHSLCVRRGGCPPGNREEQGGAIQLGRAEAAVYCAFVGKRLPTESEWALVSPSVDSETPIWTQAPFRPAERRAVRCAAEAEPLVDHSLGERLGLIAAPSTLAVRLHAAALQAHTESEPRMAALIYRALGEELGGQAGGRAFRWAAEAHRNAGERPLAREAYALYLDARDGIDADARTSSLARALGFGESNRSLRSSPASLPASAVEFDGTHSRVPAPAAILSGVSERREREWADFRLHFNTYLGLLGGGAISWSLTWLPMGVVPTEAEGMRMVPVAGAWIAIAEGDLDSASEVVSGISGALQGLSFAAMITGAVGMALTPRPPGHPPAPRASIAPLPGGFALSVSGSL